MFVLYSVPVWIWLASLKPKNALNYLVHHHSCQLGGYPESIWVVWKKMMMIPKQWSLSPDEGTLWHVKDWRSVKMEHITNVVESTNDIVQFHNPKRLRLWNWAFFSILFDNLLDTSKIIFFISWWTMALIAILRLNKTADWLQLGNFHWVASVSIAMLTWIVSTPFSHQGRQN